MQKISKLRLGVVAAVTAALALGAVAPAYADPSSQKQLSGTGSDTTQDVMSGVASAVSAIGSYDATGSSTITVNGVTFSRPVGSTAGVRALSASIQGIAYAGTTLPVNTLQFARSSDLKTESGTQLTYVPFARDAVAIAMSASSDFPSDVSLGLPGQSSTLFTLRNIYLGTVTTFIDSVGNSITIRPLLPQQNSGTRKFWVSTLGTTEAALTAGGRATDLGNSVIEHDGTFLTRDGDIAPFSVGQYLAQGNHASLPTAVVERRGNIKLGGIDGFKPIVYDGTRIMTNPDFVVSRLVYNVVETRALTTGSPSTLDLAIRAAFVGTSSSVCQATTQITQYGFAPIGSACGGTTLQRGFVA